MIGGISGWQLLILLLIVVLVFGTKRLRNIGSDLGSAVRGFRKGMEEDTDEARTPPSLGAGPEADDPGQKPAKEQEPAAHKPDSDV